MFWENWGYFCKLRKISLGRKYWGELIVEEILIKNFADLLNG
jgi:hypothetical protein